MFGYRFYISLVLIEGDFIALKGGGVIARVY